MQLPTRFLTVLIILVLLMPASKAEEQLRAEISYPQLGYNLSGPVVIRGSAGGSQFASYSLRLKKDASYHLLGDSSQAVEDDVLHQLNTTLIDTGSYRLILDVRGSKGNGKTDEVPIVIDNAAPQIEKFTAEPTAVKGGKRPFKFEFILSEKGTGIKDIIITGGGSSYQIGREKRQFSAPFQVKGNQQLRLLVRDYANNTNSRSLIIDAAPPHNLTVGSSYLSHDQSWLEIGYVEFNTKQVKIKADNRVLALGIPRNSSRPGEQVTQQLEVNTGQLQPGSNELTLTVKDGLGRSSNKNFNVIYDTVSPKLKLSNLLPRQTISQNREITISATDNLSGIDNVKLMVDGRLLTTFTTAGEQRQTLNVQQLGEGEHEITLQAKDKAGNLATQTRDLTIDLSAPEIKQLKARPNPTNSLTSLQIKASDRFSPLVKAKYGLIEGENYRKLGEKKLKRGKRQFELVVRQLEPGNNKFWVKVMDAEGQWSAVSEQRIRLDPSLQTRLQLVKQLPATVRQGQRRKIKLVWENTGQMELSNLSLTANKSLVKAITPSQTNIRANKVSSFTLDVELPPDHPLGNFNLSVAADSLGFSQQYNLTLNVLPGNHTKRAIENESERLYLRLDQLQQDLKGLSEVNSSLYQTVKREIKSERSKLEQASGNISLGDYQAAYDLTKSITNQTDKIEQQVGQLRSLKGMREKKRRTVTLLLLTLGIIGAIAFYVAYPVDEGYNLGRGYIKAREQPWGKIILTAVRRKVGKVVKKLKQLYSKIKQAEDNPPWRK